MGKEKRRTSVPRGSSRVPAISSASRSLWWRRFLDTGLRSIVLQRSEVKLSSRLSTDCCKSLSSPPSSSRRHRGYCPSGTSWPLYGKAPTPTRNRRCKFEHAFNSGYRFVQANLIAQQRGSNDRMCNWTKLFFSDFQLLRRFNFYLGNNIAFYCNLSFKNVYLTQKYK